MKSKFLAWFNGQFPKGGWYTSDKTNDQLLSEIEVGKHAERELHARQHYDVIQDAALKSWCARDGKKLQCCWCLMLKPEEQLIQVYLRPPNKNKFDTRKELLICPDCRKHLKGFWKRTKESKK